MSKYKERERERLRSGGSAQAGVESLPAEAFFNIISSLVLVLLI